MESPMVKQSCHQSHTESVLQSGYGAFLLMFWVIGYFSHVSYYFVRWFSKLNIDFTEKKVPFLEFHTCKNQSMSDLVGSFYLEK